MKEPNPLSRPAIPPASALPVNDSGRLADAQTARGVALIGRGQLSEAIAAFGEAVKLVPANAIARTNLAMTLARAGALAGDEGQLAEAVEQQRMAVRLQPGSVGPHHKLAAILAIADRVHDALAVLDEALQLDPGNANTRGLRSVAQLTLGDFANGWLDFDSRLHDPSRRAHDIPGVPRWRGETLSGTLLINGMAEGQGDCIQGIRFAAEARRRVASTVLLCLPSMARLMSRCDGVDRVVTTRERLSAVAAQIAPLYLAAIFRATPGTMKSEAYLSGDRATVEHWRPAIESIPGLRAGIAWRGNPLNVQDAFRSFPLAELKPLAEVPDVSLVSLQRGHGSEQLADGGLAVVDLGEAYHAGDWLTTAGVMSHLDLVISPDSAIAHLAGALGRRAWIALPRPAEWRWMRDRDDSPWYPAMRLFRQDRIGDWSGVFRRMRDALAELVATRE